MILRDDFIPRSPRSDDAGGLGHGVRGAAEDHAAGHGRGEAPDQRPAGPGHRLNLLLSAGRWRDTSPVEQIPSLLEPLGIRSYLTSTGDQATSLIRELPIHIAVVDLEVPLRDAADCREAAGPRILQMLRRLDAPPPTVVIRSRQPVERENQRSLVVALREGAFAVLDRPVHIETMLEVMRRILRRYYADLWPDR